MINRDAQRARNLGRALGTFIDGAYAMFTRDEIIAALRNALAIELALNAADAPITDTDECSECGGDNAHTVDCSHHWTQTVGAP